MSNPIKTAESCQRDDFEKQCQKIIESGYLLVSGSVLNDSNNKVVYTAIFALPGLLNVETTIVTNIVNGAGNE